MYDEQEIDKLIAFLKSGPTEDRKWSGLWESVLGSKSGMLDPESQETEGKTEGEPYGS